MIIEIEHSILELLIVQDACRAIGWPIKPENAILSISFIYFYVKAANARWLNFLPAYCRTRPRIMEKIQINWTRNEKNLT